MIRKATINDKKEVLMIYNDAKAFIKAYNSPQWQDGPPNEESFLKDLANKELYVNVFDNKIVAVATLISYEPTYLNINGEWLNNEDAIIIHRIATAKDSHNKGHAKKFLDFIENTLKYKNIKIDTHTLNEPMIKFLTKNGFVLCGEITLNKPFDNKRLAYQKVIK